MSDNRSVRAIVAQLAGLPPLTLGDVTLTGVELALTVAINPELPYAEAMRTPQLIAELGRLTARALRAKEETELTYRIWRDGLVHRLTNDIEAAKAAGFECAVNPGTDAKGNPKEPKTPAASAVEVYLRTLPEYRQLYDAQNAATETWAALHSAFEGAKARQWAIRMKEDSGGNATGRAAEPEEAGPTWDPTAGHAPPLVATTPPPTFTAPPPPSFDAPPILSTAAIPQTQGHAPPPPPMLAPAAPLGPPPPPPMHAPPPPVVPGPPPPPPMLGDNSPPPGFPPPGETPPLPGMEQKRKRPPPPPPPTSTNS
jgi:hypothetical protein